MLITFELFEVGIVHGSKRGKGRPRGKDVDGTSHRQRESAKDKVEELEGKKSPKNEEKEKKRKRKRKTRREGREVKKPRGEDGGTVTLRRAPGELGDIGTKKKHRRAQKERFRRRHHSKS
ncbi:hypothetical protein GPALN_008037 [Globodera pallida]|nr:hypothetical protein GPALN_008037 [Globodera pallida]